MAFGDTGKRKKSPFEKLTMLVVIIMVLVTVGAIFMTAISALI
ncbi:MULTISPECIES: DUF4044 domain-containing protein [Streptococcus]|uniref:DUF4044 domain-containing protein n=1 Tax=Streptococcus danieliae TaxID=747656 RepID=A0A7X3G7A8_9STRE|nr:MULTISPECIES: DUF4044 domain-containing protein [Streptococcus]MBF0699053.1 DUF4044 domain-containing protein [Streptococcus danieliae]MBF0805411.1 DUF4044 domain-containing protein [Streptococcus sp. 19428wA2_WM07]MBF0843514.1 DUF4044 domain-containing protein [Streptococcus danieliae]MVX58340.1 DUF4044 domain-containing protein [Streptococcus danieliae]NYS33460.1 DUF4044 domain-containing protein [Streptococcus danieliae]